MKSNISNPFTDLAIVVTGSDEPTIQSVLSVTYSQCYEDAIIDGLIRVFAKRNNIDESLIPTLLTYVEIGANHPIAGSSTYYLNQKYKVSGLLIEANPDLIPNLERVRTNDKIINRAVVADSSVKEVLFHVCEESEVSSIDPDFVTEWKNGELGIKKSISVETITANELLSMTDKSLVFLSIDVEGYDLQILYSIDFEQHRPYIVQLEPSDNYRPGTSDKMIKYMEERDYELAGMTDVNLIFRKIR